jgi:hypothetical protein
MKRSILVALVFLFTVSTSGQAQQQNAADARDAQTSRLRVIASSQAQQENLAQTVYLRWRQEAPADEVSKLRFALATVTRRAGPEEAEVEFWVVGRNSETVFEIRPLYSEKLPNGGFKQEQTGEIAKSIVKNVVESQRAQTDTGYDFGLKTVVRVSPNTNEFEIKWRGYGGGKLQNSATIHVFLADEQSENLTRIAAN